MTHSTKPYPVLPTSSSPNLKLVPNEARFAMIPACVLKLGDGEAIGLYAILVGYADERGECFPSIATLVKDTGWGRSKVYRALAVLVNAGMIEQCKRDNRGMNQSNLYRLNAQKTLQRQSSQGETAQSHSETLAVPRRDAGSPKVGREQEPVELQPEEQEPPPLPPKGPSALEQRFDRFWAVYPRKEAKAAAKRTWMRLRPNDDLTATMVAAIERQKHSEQWRKDGGRYIPHPATWLNQGRWEDEGTAVTKPKPRYVV